MDNIDGEDRIGMRLLDDELEFYELVELDAEGEAVDDQTFDDMKSQHCIHLSRDGKESRVMNINDGQRQCFFPVVGHWHFKHWSR